MGTNLLNLCVSFGENGPFLGKFPCQEKKNKFKNKLGPKILGGKLIC